MGTLHLLAGRRPAKHSSVGPGVPMSIALQQGRTDGLTSSIRASVIVPLHDSASHDPTQLKIVNSSGTEQPMLAPVQLGVYAGSDRPRVLYTEIDISGATGAETYTAHFDQGPATLTPLASRTYGSWEDPTTHELPSIMMSDRRQTGHPPAMVVPSDAEYMCGSGAFGQLVSRATAEAHPVLGAQAAEFHALIDYWLVGVHFNDALASNGGATIHCTNTNASFNTHDLTDPATGFEFVTSWVGTARPPGWGNWRTDAGVTGFGGKGQNYYNPDASYLKEFARSANMEFLWQGCSIAEAYRHATMNNVQVTDLGGGNFQGEVRPMFGNMELQQPEGMGLCYLMTGNPDHRAALQQLVHFMTIEGGAPSIGTSAGSGFGWGRPQERYLAGHLWAYLTTRSGEGSQDYEALLGDAVDAVTLGTSWSKWQGTNPATGLPYWEKDTWNTDNLICTDALSDIHKGPGIDTFANGAQASQMALVDDLAGAILTSAQRTTILDQVTAASDRAYEMVEGGPEVAPTNYRRGYPKGVGLYNGFNSATGHPPDCNEANYDFYVNLLLAFHVHVYAWLAAKHNDGEYTAIFNRLFTAGLGTRDGASPTGPGDIGYYDGTKAPYFPDIKISHQFPRFSIWALGQLPNLPPATAISGDVPTVITIQDSVSKLMLDTPDVLFATTDTNTSREAHLRGLNNWKIGDGTLSVSSDNPNISASINTTTGLITLTATAAGSATITVTDGTLSATFPVTAQTPQFVETFPGSSIDGSKWTSTGTVTVASGIGHVAGSPASSLTEINAVNLNTAGAFGAQIDVNTWDVTQNYIIVGPSTGTYQGFAFAFTFGGFQIGYWTGGAFSQQGANVVASGPLSVRFRVASGVMYMEYNLGSGWVEHSHYTIAGSAGDFDVTSAILKVVSNWGSGTAGIDLDGVTIF